MIEGVSKLKDNIKILSSAGYSILNGDGYEVIAVSTGASNRVVQFPDATANAGRKIKFVKTDSGIGFIECDPIGTDKVRGSTTSLYIIAQGEEATFIAIGTDWVLIGNPIRTVGVFVVNTGNPAPSTITGGAWTDDPSLHDLGDGITEINIYLGVFLSDPVATVTAVGNNIAEIQGAPTTSLFVVETITNNTSVDVDCGFQVIVTGPK
jgi:hypothetical protein